MKNIIFIAALLVLYSDASAQSAIKTLHVGDTVPDYHFANSIQNNGASLSLRGFKGKYILLDFWWTGCWACVDAFPEIQRLQDRFGDKLQIIMVNEGDHDDSLKIKKLFQRIKQYNNLEMTMPVTLLDTNFSRMIPHPFDPFEVIIDPNGKIVTCTSLKEVTAEKMQKLLSGEPVSFEVSSFYVDKNIPLLLNMGTSHVKDIVMSTSLVTWQSSVGMHDLKYDDQGRTIGYITRENLLDFYEHIYPQLFEGEHLTIYETKDTIFKDHRHPLTYDMNWPADKIKDPDSIRKFFVTSIKRDILMNYNFDLKREKRDTNCLIIRTNSKFPHLYTKFEETEGNYDQYDQYGKKGVAIIGHRVSLPGLVGGACHAAGFNTAKTIVETSDENLFDIVFPAGFDCRDWKKLQTFLSSKGIDISIEKRTLDALVVRDPK